MPDLSLAKNFLVKYGAIIDLKGQCSLVVGKKVPLVTYVTTGRPQVGTLSADVMVPPRREIMVPKTIKVLADNSLVGMLESAASLTGQCDVLIA